MIIHKISRLLARSKNFGTLNFLPRRSQFLLSLLYLSRGLLKLKPFPYVKVIKIPSKIGNLFLSGDKYFFDLVAFHYIFVQQIYKTDYQNTSVIDVGAHKGYYAAYALKEGAKKVISFEPEGNNFACLSRSARSFKEYGCKIEVYNACVGSRSGKATLYSMKECLSHSLFPRKDKRIIQEERVQMVDFSSILSRVASEYEENIILKINAEGAECDIILNSHPKQLELINEVFVWYHFFSSCSKEKIVKQMKMAGFKCLPSSDKNLLHFVTA